MGPLTTARALVRGVAAGTIAIALAAPAASAQSVRPFQDPARSNHWMLATMEPKHLDEQWYMHEGVDLPGRHSGPDGELVVAVAEGTIHLNKAVCLHETCTASDWAELGVRGDDGLVYLYVHLEPDEIAPELAAACNWDAAIGNCIPAPGTKITVDMPLGYPYPWIVDGPGCDISHLHLQVGTEDLPDDRYDVPVPHLDPFSDADPPVVNDVVLCEDDAGLASPADDWTACERLEPLGCPSLSGELDLLVNVSDRHTSGTTGTEHHLGVRSVEWQLCTLTPFSCGSWHTLFDLSAGGMPEAWGSAEDEENATTTIVSTRGSPTLDVTTRDEDRDCGSDSFWYIATNSGADGTPDRGGSIQSAALVGGIVRIRVHDFAGNDEVVSRFVCPNLSLAPVTCPPDLHITQTEGLSLCELITRGPDVMQQIHPPFRIPIEVELATSPPQLPPFPWPIELARDAEFPLSVCVTAIGPQVELLEKPLSFEIYVAREFPAIVGDDGAVEMLRDPAGTRTVAGAADLVLPDGLPAGDEPWRRGHSRCADVNVTLPAAIATREAAAGLNVYAVVTSGKQRPNGLADRGLDPRSAAFPLVSLIDDARERALAGTPLRRAPAQE